MLRLYQPCLPTRVPKAPTGDCWVHEIKHDGFRIVSRRIGGVVRLQTKQGCDYAERYPLIVQAIRRFKVTSVVVDGEAMCFTGATHDCDKVWNRTHDDEAKRCDAFDLLELDGNDYRQKPLVERKKERKKKLFKLLKKPWDGIEYVEHLQWAPVDGSTGQAECRSVFAIIDSVITRPLRCASLLVGRGRSQQMILHFAERRAPGGPGR